MNELGCFDFQPPREKGIEFTRQKWDIPERYWCSHFLLEDWKNKYIFDLGMIASSEVQDEVCKDHI